MNEVSNRIPEIDDFFRIEEEDGKKIVKMDERLVGLIDAFGSRIAQSLKMSFLQGLGAQSKIEKGLQGAMALDIVEDKMPIINLVGDFLGFNTKQYISKHPQALGQLLQMAGPFLKNFNVQGLMKNNGGNTPNPSHVPTM